MSYIELTYTYDDEKATFRMTHLHNGYIMKQDFKDAADAYTDGDVFLKSLNSARMLMLGKLIEASSYGSSSGFGKMHIVLVKGNELCLEYTAKCKTHEKQVVQNISSMIDIMFGVWDDIVPPLI